MYDFQVTHYGRRELPPKFNWTFGSTPTHVFHYVINGSCTYYYDNKTVIGKPGHLYLRPQQLKCRAEFDEQSHFDHLFFDFFYSKAYKSEDIIDIEVDKYPVLKQTLTLMSDYVTANLNGEFKYDRHLNHMSELFNFLLYILESHKLIPYIDNPRIDDALKFIHAHFQDNITVYDIAKNSNLCIGHFSALFKEIMTISPYQYIKQIRLTTAIRLIRDGISVSDAAELCGYQSVYSLSAAIKKNSGYSPSWLKRNM